MKKENTNISDKEKEILESYEIEEYVFTEEEAQEELNNTEQEEVLELFEEETTEPIINDEVENIQINEDEIEEEPIKEKKFHKKLFIIIGIILVLILVPATMIITDVIRVSKYKQTPLFAVITKTHKDGGTKEYTGLGYKVIKYNQKQGRRDIEIGTWNLKYNNDILEAEAIDLAIEFTENEANSYEKYKGKFMRISGVLSNVSMNENTITISYIDEDGKYNFDILCDMASDTDKLKEFETNIRITAIGTVSNYEFKTPDSNATLHLSNCFAEQDL